MHCTLDLEISPEIIHNNSSVLTNLLAKARVKSYPEALAQLRSQQAGFNDNSSIAAVAAKADGIEVTTGAWLMADPVNLVLQRDVFSLYPEVPVQLSRDEATDYQTILNQHFKDRGISFYLGTSGQWYVNATDQSLSANAYDMTNPIHAMGKSVDAFMPHSAEMNQWMQVQNEIQMLLFECSASQNREHSGLVPVNSIWFYGAGDKPAVNCAMPVGRQYVSNAPFYQGLAQRSQSTAKALPERASDYEALLRQYVAGDVVVDLTRNPDWEALVEVCARLLKQRVIKQLTLQLGLPKQTLIANLKPIDHWRVWRKSHPLTHYL